MTAPLRRVRVSLGLVVVAALILPMAACSSPGNPKVPAGAKSSGGRHAVIETDKGAIEIEFFAQESPRAVENFRLLAEHGYYDGLTFHRIVRGFMIQGGDPAGDGTGGESAWGAPFPDDIAPDSPLYRTGYRRGIVAMMRDRTPTAASSSSCTRTTRCRRTTSSSRASQAASTWSMPSPGRRRPSAPTAT